MKLLILLTCVAGVVIDMPFVTFCGPECLVFYKERAYYTTDLGHTFTPLADTEGMDYGIYNGPGRGFQVCANQTHCSCYYVPSRRLDCYVAVYADYERLLTKDKMMQKHNLVDFVADSKTYGIDQDGRVIDMHKQTILGIANKKRNSIATYGDRVAFIGPDYVFIDGKIIPGQFDSVYMLDLVILFAGKNMWVL